MKPKPPSLFDLLDGMKSVPRPYTAPRSPRKEGKAAHYEREKPCRKCGGHLFYRSVNRCVPCSIAYAVEYQRQRAAGRVPRTPAAASSNRQAALARGDARYHREQPCDQCGGHEYYTKGRACVACHREVARRSAAEHYHKQKGRY